jgi:ketosteroid isomerase-like protein
MSQKNVEVVRQFFQEMLDLGPLPEWGEDEVAAFERWTTPDIEYHEDPAWPGADTYRGRGEVQRAFLRYFEVFPDMSGSLQSVHGAGEATVALVRFTGQAATSGVPNAHLWGYVCGVESGCVSSVRAYWNPDEALEAAGLSE